jgi:hypothetical protein
MQMQSWSRIWLVEALIVTLASSGLPWSMMWHPQHPGKNHITPGPIPIIAHGTDPMDAEQLALLHDEFRCIHTNRVDVDQALKRTILEAFDNMYTSQLEDSMPQYENRSALEILVHLQTT